MMNPNSMQAFMQFMQNPAAFFQQKGMQVPPQNALKSPQDMIQYMMNGQQNNPQFMQMIQGYFNK